MQFAPAYQTYWQTINIAHEAQILQVTGNLLTNAAKYMDDGGLVELILEREGDDYARIRVRDHGVGIPEEERKVVFDRFTRGSTASHSGSGLGLALVAQQAELHGGTATLMDSPLGGARLLLQLPGVR